MTIRENLTKSFNLKVWHLLLVIVVCFGFGKSVGNTVTVERVIEKPVKVEVERIVQADCSDQEIKITKLKKVIELDGEVFGMTGKFMGKLDYWLLHPAETVEELTVFTAEVNRIANEKRKIMGSL